MVWIGHGELRSYNRDIRRHLPVGVDIDMHDTAMKNFTIISTYHKYFVHKKVCQE